MAFVVSLFVSLLLFTAQVSCGKSHHRDSAPYAISSLASKNTTKHFHFKVGYMNVRRLNTKKRLIAVNGKFPGPTIYANEGDRLIIKVTNAIKEDVAIHWHGVRQFRSCWADGTAFITQCPIRPGKSFTHNFTVEGQTGTLLWHAHISWLRSTLHGAIVIFPKPGVRHPFHPQPDYAVPIILGEWWNGNTQLVETSALSTGAAPNVSDAATINGYPGPLYSKSKPDDVFTLNVVPGKTYQLNLVSAALEVNYYFSIAYHSLAVVAMDATYVQPYTTDVVYLSPGQTADVLLSTNLTKGAYYMAATVFSIVPEEDLGFPHNTTTAILRYPGTRSSAAPLLPDLPAHNDTAIRQDFIDRMRSTNSTRQVAPVPLFIDRPLQFTVGYALEPNNTCPPLALCQGVNNTRFSAAVNNISFDNPWNTSLLQAFFLNEPVRNLFLGFPNQPTSVYNYTGIVPANTTPRHSTKVVVLNFGETVELVLQGTAILEYDIHPFHLHGYNFYIVGEGYGNYDPLLDPLTFNLIDPPQRNTAGVPAGGWIAIRWTANNPGVWLLHCHLEMHLSWGMEMAFVVRNGVRLNETLLPPPPDYPHCVKYNSTPH
ncbi:hypothetical protein M758_UG191900 [Ceratodon purpureus]|nr:hypothetical protein M758_UG191900 [Ceratodon purpureus]KAG0595728.1 hypothetical protein M758_UG191900 [Ceratodon purpureus]